MIRSQSAPELGKGRSPLQGFQGDSRSLLTLSTEEEEAERLYYSLASCSITKTAFSVYARELTRRSEAAGAYLTWLICRGRDWPKVAGCIGKCGVSSCSRALVPSAGPSND